MKLIGKRIVIVFVILFVLVNVASCQHESNIDGWDFIGFPFKFYLYTEGKCDDCRDVGFKPLGFMLDIFFTWGISVVIVFIASKVSKPK